jgi:hypothetical protein
MFAVVFSQRSSPLTNTRSARLSGEGIDRFAATQGPMAQKPSRQRWRVAGRS